MEIITAKELQEITAGGDGFIRTKNNTVKGLAVTTTLNPEAPEIVVVGKGPNIEKNAQRYLEQDEYVPLYIKQAVNQWSYAGDFKAIQYSTDPSIIEKHRRHRPINKVAGILFLSKNNEEDVIITPQNVDPLKRKAVEVAAVDFVCMHYTKQGYTVRDRQHENCGYDLLIEKASETLKVEVKGTSGIEQRFFLSRNERLNSSDPLWRIAIVTDVLKIPELEILNTSDMEDRFKFDCLAWECTVK